MVAESVPIVVVLFIAIKAPATAAADLGCSAARPANSFRVSESAIAGLIILIAIGPMRVADHFR